MNGTFGIQPRHPLPDQAITPTPPFPPTELSFESDIKPLFRENPDRSAMLGFGLDLHEYEDVRDRAADIAERLEDGTMPCDGAWPQKRIDLFNQWVAQGAQP